LKIFIEHMYIMSILLWNISMNGAICNYKCKITQKFTKQMDGKFSLHMKWLLMQAIHTKNIVGCKHNQMN